MPRLSQLPRAALDAVHRLDQRDFKEFHIQRELDRSDRGVYLEIGVRDGACLRRMVARDKTGVDPVRTPAMHRLRAGESFFETTSDDFFERHARQHFGSRRVDVALIDGLHRFQQVLADVLNTAPWMQPSGTIVLDDCYPRTEQRASEEPTGWAWSGDVWRAVALLRATQTQWRVVTVHADHGVGLISGFHEPAVPIDADQVRRFAGLPFQALQADPGIIGLVPGSSTLSRRVIEGLRLR